MSEKKNVNFAWTPDQITVVKRAAALAGVPYQSWLKVAVWRAAVQAIKDAIAAKIIPSEPALDAVINDDAIRDAFEAGARAFMVQDSIARKHQEAALPETYAQWTIDSP